MKRYLNLYLATIRHSIIKNMAYPQDFLLWSAVDLLWSIINILFFRILLLNLPNISGWTFNQIIIPLGFVHLIGAFVWGVMYSNMKELARDVNKGNLDLYLSKPANSQFLLSTRYLDFNLLPSVVVGSFLLWYGFSINNISSPSSLLIVLIALISGVGIAYSLYFMSVTTSLWANRLQNIQDLFPNTLDFAKYPSEISPVVTRFIFNTILPFALIGYLPANILLGKASSWLLLSFLATALIFVYISHLFWNFALRHYSSASS